MHKIHIVYITTLLKLSDRCVHFLHVCVSVGVSVLSVCECMGVSECVRVNALSRKCHGRNVTVSATVLSANNPWKGQPQWATICWIDRVCWGLCGALRGSSHRLNSML